MSRPKCIRCSCLQRVGWGTRVKKKGKKIFYIRPTPNTITVTVNFCSDVTCKNTSLLWESSDESNIVVALQYLSNKNKLTLKTGHDKTSNSPWTSTLNFTVTAPTLLLTEQVYSPPSKDFIEVMVKTLLLEWSLCDWCSQVYEGLGFPTAKQSSCRGSPSAITIGFWCDDASSWGLSAC